jgi:hypothetical protein
MPPLGRFRNRESDLHRPAIVAERDNTAPSCPALPLPQLQHPIPQLQHHPLIRPRLPRIRPEPAPQDARQHVLLGESIAGLSFGRHVVVVSAEDYRSNQMGPVHEVPR